MNHFGKTETSATIPTKIYKFFVELVELDNDRLYMHIWRTLEIPESYSFYELHVAIQDAMKWLDVEIHKFDMINPVTKQLDYIGIEDDLMCEAVVCEKDALIANYFSLSNSKCTYMYNFFKPWNFRITLEKILPAIPNIKYPRCVAGNGMLSEDAIGEFSINDSKVDLKNISFRDPEVAWLDAFQGF